MSRRNGKRHALLLFVLAIGMFGFAFALVPLYEAFCEITGLNGRTSSQAALFDEIDTAAVPVERNVTIGFLATVGRGMPWEFRPNEKEIRVRPGEMNRTTFHVRNRSPQAVTGQAVPSVAPAQAAQYLKKMECFCFEQQELPAGGEMDMPVTFLVDADLPAHITELTLSYTMFRVGEVEHLVGHQDQDEAKGL